MSAANGGTSGGQAPASGQQPGQAPQANNSGSPSAEPQGQAPNGNTSPSSPSGQQLSQADYDRIIGDLRRENAGHRTENAKIAADLKKFQDAQLTDVQKRERDFTDLQTAKRELELRNQRLTLENAGFRLGASLGIGDIGAALALVQAEHASEVKYASDGTPENISDLLKAVLKDHPVLVAQSQRSQTPAPTGGGVTNPGRQAGNGGLTLEMIKAMPMRERMARINEITAWEKANAASQRPQS